VQESATRLTAQEIFEGTLDNAREELSRSSTGLFFSGVAGGLTMGLTGLSVSIVTALLGTGPTPQVLAAVVYPIGFVSVIIGRAQLFTENTLYPVVLVLTDKQHILQTLRLWSLVYAGNLVGSLGFAALAVWTTALRPAVRDALISLGVNSVSHPARTVFWSAVVAGWLLALVAWLVTASHWTTGQALVTWTLTFVLGLGHFAHCVASSGEIMSAVVSGAVGLSTYGSWLVAATLGNIVGGVVMVSLLNYGQVETGRRAARHLRKAS
jgi:formate/nitrite transporter FocA (FNT family)